MPVMKNKGSEPGNQVLMSKQIFHLKSRAMPSPWVVPKKQGPAHVVTE